MTDDELPDKYAKIVWKPVAQRMGRRSDDLKEIVIVVDGKEQFYFEYHPARVRSLDQRDIPVIDMTDKGPVEIDKKEYLGVIE